ncbi:MAG: oligosaccharide flippase family protein [bacterium]
MTDSRDNAANAGCAHEAVNASGPAYFSHEAVGGLPWMILNKVLMLFVYMGLSVLTVRLLGPEEYGRFALIRNITDYLVVLCALGLDVALLRFIPELTAHHNQAGLRRLLVKSLVLQQGAALLSLAALLCMKPWLDRWFNMDFRGLLLPAGLLLGATVLKDSLNNAFTALFKVRTVALLSFINGVLWLAFLVGALRWRPEAAMALTAQTISLLLVYGVSLVMLTRLVSGLEWRSPPRGVGRHRTLKLSLPTMFNTILRMLMMKYTEVFFLGIYFTPVVVGYYDLGYSTPQLVLTLIPAALQTLFTSAFAQSYTRDPNCLGRMIDSVYKLTILIVMPLAAFGIFFAPRGIVLLYGSAMSPAGPVAAAFCILHVLPLISTPLSMAITVKEKVLQMLPYMLLQVGMNLLLDWLLIPRFGIAGAIAAVALTFILTIPWRLRAVRNILGSINFPVSFFLRQVLATVILAAVLSPLAPHLGLVTFVLVAASYLALYPVLIRLLHLIRPEEMADLRSLGIKRINRALDLMTGTQRLPATGGKT